jgi:hypothetical protein
MALTNLLLKPNCMLKPFLNVFVLCVKKTISFFVIGKYDVMIFYFYFGETRLYAFKTKKAFFFNFMFFLCLDENRVF